MPQLIVSAAARQDLIEIGDYIAVADRARARAFVAEIEQIIVEQIAVRPNSFRLRPELAPDLRAAVYRRYLICFTATDEAIVVVRVLHGARDLGSLF